MDLLQISAWKAHVWLAHGFTQRAGGSSTVYGEGELNLGYTAEDERACVDRNRGLLQSALGFSAPLATARQVHGAAIERVPQAWQPTACDGLVTAEPGVCLAIQVADCVPVLLVDPRQRVVAAVHAGWRGTVERIAARAVERMAEEFGSRPEDLEAAIGPSIGPCCFQVGPEVRERFRESFADAYPSRATGPDAWFRTAADGSLYGDLWAANRQQMLSAGVSRVYGVGECTACTRTVDGRRKYFSYRAEGGRTGRAMGVAGIR